MGAIFHGSIAALKLQESMNQLGMLIFFPGPLLGFGALIDIDVIVKLLNSLCHKIRNRLVTPF
jgi:hypothetical protein